MKPEGVRFTVSVSLAKHLANETRKQKVKEVKQMYKMEVYRAEEKTLFRTEKSNNLEYFDRYKNRTNYKIKIFQKVKNRWKLIYSEV